MRTVSGPRNRTLLIILGIILILIGALLGLLSSGALSAMPWAPDQATSLGSLAQPAQGYLIVLAIIAVVLFLLALWWLIAQIPTKDRTLPYRVADDPRHGIATVQPETVARAVQDQLEAIPGVTRAQAQLAGTAEEPELLARLTSSPRADINRVLEQFYRGVVRDLENAMGNPLRHVGVSLHVGRESTESTKTSVRTTGSASESPEQRALA